MFEKWYQELSEDLSRLGEVEKISKGFSKINSDIDRILFAAELDAVRHFVSLHTPAGFKGKDAAVAREHRRKGNELFQQKKYENARQEYTISILLSPLEGNENDLAMGYANRSATLLHAQLFRQCLRDIELALENRYPSELQYKIFERQGKCHAHLGDPVSANKSFTKALESLCFTSLTVEKKNTLARSILHAKAKLKLITMDTDMESSRNTMDVPCIPDSSRNRKFPCATDSFDIGMNPICGRYAFAARDISAGSVIVVEAPHASVLLPNAYHVNCHHCLSRTMAPIACRQCSYVSFCSSDCEHDAWESYHQHECRVLPFIDKADVGLAKLAFRMIAKTPSNGLSGFENTDDNQRYDLSSGLDFDGRYVSSNYATAWFLEGHSKDRSLADLFKRTVTALLLAHCLTTTSYMQRSSDKVSVNVLASHLLRHIQMLPCNAHEVAEHHLYKQAVAQSYNVEIGSAIYPVLSLLNHSCDPNVVRHCYGDVCVLRALKHIPQGAEIVDNYGALYAVTEKDQRNMLLQSQYYFTCQCQACQKDWPLYVDMKVKDPIFECERCHDPLEGTESCCGTCRCAVNSNAKQMFAESQQKFKTAMEQVLDKADLASLGDITSHLDLTCRLVQLPWQELNSCQEIVKQCYSMKSNCVVEDGH